MADVSLIQSLCLKQPLGEYIEQFKNFAQELHKFRDEATNFLFQIQARTNSSDKLFKNDDIAFMDIDKLRELYSKAIPRIKKLTSNLDFHQTKLDECHKVYATALVQKE